MREGWKKKRTANYWYKCILLRMLYIQRITSHQLSPISKKIHCSVGGFGLDEKRRLQSTGKNVVVAISHEKCCQRRPLLFSPSTLTSLQFSTWSMVDSRWRCRLPFYCVFHHSRGFTYFSLKVFFNIFVGGGFVSNLISYVEGHSCVLQSWSRFKTGFCLITCCNIL